jgi:ketosteroid isomerase-like protein
VYFRGVQTRSPFFACISDHGQKKFIEIIINFAPTFARQYIFMENIKQFFAGMAAMLHPSDFTLTTKEVMLMGEAACEIGNYSLTLNPEGQPPMQDNGKYVVIWQPQADGSWKIHIDTWNTDIPMPPPDAIQ